MQISSTRINAFTPATRPQSQPSPEQSDGAASDSVTFGQSSAGEMVLGAGLMGGLGAVGIGGPAALTLGSVKSFMNGNWILGAGLGAAAAVSIPTVGLTGLGLAAMTTDSGDSFGLNCYLAGGALTAAATGWAMFG